MAEVLDAGSVVLQGGATTRDAAIDEAGALLVAAGAVSQAYVAAMHERETSVSTYMGNGLAIPHGTNEAKSEIARSAMCFIRYADPIDWKGQPAEFVVGIAGWPGQLGTPAPPSLRSCPWWTARHSSAGALSPPCWGAPRGRAGACRCGVTLFLLCTTPCRWRMSLAHAAGACHMSLAHLAGK